MLMGRVGDTPIARTASADASTNWFTKVKVADMLPPALKRVGNTLQLLACSFLKENRT